MLHLCALFSIFISIYKCIHTHIHISFQNHLKVNHGILPLNTSACISWKQEYPTSPKYHFPTQERKVMLTQYYKLIYSIHSGSLNCSNDVFYRFFFPSGSPARIPYFICSHLVSLNLGQSPIILSFMLVTLLKGSCQLSWRMSHRGYFSKVNLIYYFILCT